LWQGKGEIGIASYWGSPPAGPRLGFQTGPSFIIPKQTRERNPHVIYDEDEKEEIVKAWMTVKALSKSSHRQSVIPGGGVISETPPEGFRNLPLVLAYAVLEEILNGLRRQGIFTCGSDKLGAKMDASMDVLPWQDYGLVKTGREARNQLAHEAKLLDDKQCLIFIEAVEAELIAWGVI
jgi:hypothetical protein